VIVSNNTVGQFAWGQVYTAIFGDAFASEHYLIGFVAPIVVNCGTLIWTGHRVTRLGAGGMVLATIATVAIAELGIVTSASAPIVGVQAWHGVANVIGVWSLLVPLYALLGAIGAYLGRRQRSAP